MNYFAHGYEMDGRVHGHVDSVYSWLFMLLMMAILILGVVLILRLIAGGNSNSDNDALNTLKNRYAKGEITKKQFDKMKKDIK